jgi:hypothetical protein
MVHQPHSLSVWAPPSTAVGTRQPAAARARGQGAAQPPWPGGDYLTSHAKQTRAPAVGLAFLCVGPRWTGRRARGHCECGAGPALVFVTSPPSPFVPFHHAREPATLFCFAFRRRASFSLHLPCRCVAHGHGQLGRPNRSMCIIHCLAHPVYYLLCQPSSIKRIQYYRYSKLQKLLYAMLY